MGWLMGPPRSLTLWGGVDCPSPKWKYDMIQYDDDLTCT